MLEANAELGGEAAGEVVLQALGSLGTQVVAGRQVESHHPQLAAGADLLQGGRGLRAAAPGAPRPPLRLPSPLGGRRYLRAPFSVNANPHWPQMLGLEYQLTAPGSRRMALNTAPIDHNAAFSRDFRAGTERYRSGHNGADSKSDGRVKPARGFESHPLRHLHLAESLPGWGSNPRAWTTGFDKIAWSDFDRPPGRPPQGARPRMGRVIPPSPPFASPRVPSRCRRRL